MKVKVKNYTAQEDFKKLYDGSAWTWEGLSFDESVARMIANDFTEEKLIAKDCETLEFWVTDGLHMNSQYNLTGDNAYPSDLTIVSIPLECLDGKCVIARFMYGVRWFDDIVDNNSRREQEKAGEREKARSIHATPFERTRAAVYATGNKWAIENFEATH